MRDRRSFVTGKDIFVLVALAAVSILAAVFCGHVNLKSDHGICTIQTGCVNGVAAILG